MIIMMIIKMSRCNFPDWGKANLQYEARLATNVYSACGK